MAERRMFSKKVTDDDNFLSLSASAQALYLHLSMSADDDGFCNQVNLAMFKAHASVGDLQNLLEKRYLYQFENGVIVIKHWRMANALRKDRYTPTAFKEELSRLKIKENGSYTLTDDGCQLVANWLPQDRLDKDSIDKDSIDKDSVDKDSVDKDREGKDSTDKVNKKHIVYFPSDELLEKTFAEFRAMRKQIKKPMTDSAIERMVSKISKLDPDTAVRLLQESTDKCWLDIYPDKRQKRMEGWDDA